ncbi:uncharacterized protein si:zfos-905g2.1 [Anguilla rostrata]|uniref:uncharacterized protein si:zfos-905g2.1 n=1 Tax=Anguilla rostrata TaxID=7938 RepID=UPI0030D50FE5
MKQEFSPGRVNALHETLVNNAAESASPEYAGHGEAMDLPFVVVKLEDETNSSDAESVTEWTRPVEFAEDYDEEAGQDPKSVTETSTSKKYPLLKHECLGVKLKKNDGRKCSSQDFKDAGGPKKRASKQKNKSSSLPSTKGRTKTKTKTKTNTKRRIRSTTQFSKSQEALMQTFVESHTEELFRPNRKGANEYRSLWKDLMARVNAVEATANGHKTLSAVRKWAVTLKKTGVHPSRQHKERKTSLRSAPGVSAPYSRFKPASAISPQQATEPPLFPSMECGGKAQCCEKLEGALFEVLNFCKFMCTAIQRLEEKIDSLQSNSSHIQESHQNFPITDQVSWHRGAHWAPPSGSSRFGLSCLNLQKSPSLGPLEDNKMAPFSSPLARRGKPRLPRSSHSGKPASLADFQLDRPTSQRARRGGRRRRGRQRGSGGPRPVVPANQALVLGAPLSGASAKDVLPEKVPPMGPSSTASTEDEQLVLIGSSLRKVQISASEYLKAFKESDPLGAVGVILRAVFPDSVLAHSGVTGNQAAGVQQLDPNKIEAIREWLAEMFPKHDLNVRGVDWAACLGVITSVIKGLQNAE